MNRTFLPLLLSAILPIALAACIEDKIPAAQANPSRQSTSAVVTATNKPAPVSLELSIQINDTVDSDTLAIAGTQLESSCCWSAGAS